jgi:hypothetical protein
MFTLIEVLSEVNPIFEARPLLIISFPHVITLYV